MNLNSILIGSEDPKGLNEFYTAMFGSPAWEEGGYTGWQIGAGFLTVGAHDQVHGKNAEPGRVIWNLESIDVKADYERLTAAGATGVREPYSPDGGTDGWIATLSDPDGNYFQLVSPM